MTVLTFAIRFSNKLDKLEELGPCIPEPLIPNLVQTKEEEKDEAMLYVLSSFNLIEDKTVSLLSLVIPTTGPGSYLNACTNCNKNINNSSSVADRNSSMAYCRTICD